MPRSIVCCKHCLRVLCRTGNQLDNTDWWFSGESKDNYIIHMDNHKVDTDKEFLCGDNEVYYG
jgi:hypothetical protein